MDKNAIKKYAIWARRELIARVSQRAALYEITADGYGDADAVSVHGRILSLAEKNQRKALIAQIQQKGFEQVMEEIAYTWFNRFSALRFMEVNGYLPTRIRVFTDEQNNFKPQIMTEAINLEMEGLDMQKVFAFKDANDDDGLFKYLIITQCNALSSILPGMFQKIADFTELLFPDNLLREGSVVEQMVSMIPEKDWTDQVQIIGWLYQYYIAEPKDKLINAHKQYKSKDIPFVTQLFTTDWIVHYMVENSLGRLWLESHPNDILKSEWKFYLDEDKHEKNVQSHLALSRKEYANLKPEEIRVIDPCCGSGHILCTFFDVLINIYENYGYTLSEAVVKIVENNIWGLDIDERAVQLSYFSVMMKARRYDPRFLTRRILPHVYVITGSENINNEYLAYMGEVLSPEEKKHALSQAVKLIEETRGAKEYGSLISKLQYDWDLLEKFIHLGNENKQLSIDIVGQKETKELFKNLILVGRALSQQYHVVVTNPPYMNSSYMPNGLKTYIQENYSKVKNDTFSAFTQRVIKMTYCNGHIGLLMPYVWMFISSYEKMRDYVNANVTITSLVQLEYNAFEAACVPVAALTMCKTATHFPGEYIKLSEFRGTENQEPKTLDAIKNRNCGYRYTATQDTYSKIPGTPIAYWVGKRFIENLDHGIPVRKLSRTRSGAKTGKNELFIKLWWEISYSKLYLNCRDYKMCVQSGKTWFPYNKGGEAQNWYGNRELVVDFYGGGKHIKEYSDKHGTSIDLNAKDVYFKQGITWTALTSSRNTFRYSPFGAAFDSNKGPMVFPENEDKLYYLLALFISPVAQHYFKVFNPTISLQNGDVDNLPVIMDKNADEIIELSKQNVKLAMLDWDSFETSWDFQISPLLKGNYIEEAFKEWAYACENRFSTVKTNEERINKLLIDTYGFTGEISPYVSDKDITIHQADLKRDIQCLISFAVGCMFGRYSLDEKGLAYAGGAWDAEKYKSYIPDSDAIIPICDDEYFGDDIVGRFVRFIELAYGKETLEQNLAYIAKALDGKGTSRQAIRNYFVNDLFAFHCAQYAVNGAGKRPIYWLFDSGKKNGFKCLVYMHRYQPDTVARIRTDYVHEQQSRYRTAMADLQNRIDNATTTSERVKLTKKLKTVHEQDEELRIYEEKIHHLADQMIKIDLDDGVKVNYAKFQDVLAKIK